MIYIKVAKRRLSFFPELVGSTYAQDIYKFTRMAISTEVSMTKYEVPRGNVIM